MKTPILRARASMDRRGFLKTGVVAGVGSLVAGRVPAASVGSIPARRFGAEGPALPVLAYGGAALPKAWGNPLSTGERVALVRHAYDRGIRVFDTAGNYMESQAILGQALEDVRDRVRLVGKVETTDPNRVRETVEASMAELRTDRLDAVLIHGTPGLEQMTVAQAMKIHAALVRLRDEKIVGSIGFSAHAYFDKALALIRSGGFEHCLLSYGYLPRGSHQVLSPRMTELRNACVAEAHARGMGIAAMKVVAAGVLGAWSEHVVPDFDKTRLSDLPAAAIRYVLSDRRIHQLLIGMRFPHEIDANIRVLNGDTTYTLKDRALLAEYTARAYESEAIRGLRVD